MPKIRVHDAAAAAGKGVFELLVVCLHSHPASKMVCVTIRQPHAPPHLLQLQLVGHLLPCTKCTAGVTTNLSKFC
jgi:hypothetical protein